MFLRKAVPAGSSRLAIVDHTETYGRHILARCIKSIPISRCVDLGAGNGDDLSIILKQYSDAEAIGIDFGLWNEERLAKSGIRLLSIDIEKQQLPFADQSIDLVVANQIMEHTKEIFWINHEIFRTLKIGGYLFMGTPNLLSLHNRIMMLLGRHPTQHKLISAHVRPFSKTDVFRFYREVASECCSIEGFWGSQFYPLFPTQSFSIFFLIKKVGQYNDEFAKWPSSAQLETNYYTAGVT